MKLQTTKGQKLMGVGVGMVILFAGLATMAIPSNAASKVLTLQEAVENHQSAYNANHKLLEQSQVKYCEAWKSLSKSKLDLAKALSIATDTAKYEQASNTDCNKLELPTSF